MAADQERTPTPQEPVCETCHEPIRPTQNHVTIQERHYHARCYERTASKVIPPRLDGTRRGTR